MTTAPTATRPALQGLTYPEYIAECQRRQREYITGEQERIVKAGELALAYRRAMLALGLHPLTESEIIDRAHELFAMAARVEETHGDSVTMRHAYEMHFGKEPQ